MWRLRGVEGVGLKVFRVSGLSGVGSTVSGSGLEYQLSRLGLGLRV